jgi:hypothetical protein
MMTSWFMESLFAKWSRAGRQHPPPLYYLHDNI